MTIGSSRASKEAPSKRAIKLSPLGRDINAVVFPAALETRNQILAVMTSQSVRRPIGKEGLELRLWYRSTALVAARASA